LDLKRALTELQSHKEHIIVDNKFVDVNVLIQERHDLQETLKTLTEEVEFLSKKNEKFLRELQSREYYTAYKEQNEELTKLREAHAILIDLIRTKEIKIADEEIARVSLKKATQNRNSMSLYLPSTKKPITGYDLPFSRLLTCKENTCTNAKDQKRDAYECLESI